MKYGRIIMCIFVSSYVVSKVIGVVIESNVEYQCQVNKSCGYQPMGDYSTNCHKEKVCKHQFTLANQSDVRWFYSIIDEAAHKNTSLSYEALPSASFAEYNWQKSSGTVTKYRSEWDANFNRMEDPMPADPADFKIHDQYVVLALTEQALKNAVKQFTQSKNWDTIQDAIVVKIVAAISALSKHPPASALAIIGNSISPESVKFLSGWIEATSINKQDMSKITLQNRQYKP